MTSGSWASGGQRVVWDMGRTLRKPPYGLAEPFPITARRALKRASSREIKSPNGSRSVTALVPRANATYREWADVLPGLVRADLREPSHNQDARQACALPHRDLPRRAPLHESTRAVLRPEALAKSSEPRPEPEDPLRLTRLIVPYFISDIRQVTITVREVACRAQGTPRNAPRY